MVNSYCKHINSDASLMALCNNCKIKNFCFLKTVKKYDQLLFEDFLQNKIQIVKNQHLFHKDAKFKGIYLIFSGSLKSYNTTNPGKEQITRLYLPGDLIGLEALRQETYPRSIKALESTTLIEMSHTKIDAFLDKYPIQQFKLIELMAREMTLAQNLSTILRIKSADSRFASFLLDLTIRYKQVGLPDDRINISMSRNDIANYLQLAVETISRISCQLQRDNIITSKKDQITILDKERLMEIAGLSSQLEHRRLIANI